MTDAEGTRKASDERLTRRGSRVESTPACIQMGGDILISPPSRKAPRRYKSKILVPANVQKMASTTNQAASDNWLKIAVAVIVLLLLGVFGFLVLKDVSNDTVAGASPELMNQLMQDLEKKLESTDGMEGLLKDLKGRLESAVNENRALTGRLEAQQQRASAGLRRGGSDEEAQQTIATLTASRQRMKDWMQQMAKQRVLEQWGPGPHRVQMSVKFDPQSLTSSKEVPPPPLDGTIVLELAPVDEMPYSVYWFLEQVSRKLFDGCSFHRNAKHIVQAGPAKNFLSPPDAPDLLQAFTTAGFGQVLFQEYSPNFRHTPYTLGYAGRPGGPDFYINVQDNTELHGPGGQAVAVGEDPNDADPCFAKVVNGIDVVDRIHKAPVVLQQEKGVLLKYNIAITEVKLL